MLPEANGLTLKDIGDYGMALVPIAGGIVWLFRSTNNVVKAAVQVETDTRRTEMHALNKLTQQQLGTLDLRTTKLETDNASRKDLDAAEARINSNITDVKTDVREMRLSHQSILQSLAGVKALVGGKRAPEPE